MRRPILSSWMFAGLIFLASSAAASGSAARPGAPALDAIRAAGVLRCGGVPKPGLAFPDAGGHWQGLEIGLCRALAAAVLGAGDKFVFHAYLQPSDFADARDGADELVFLTGGEAISAGLPGVLAPGTAVFFETAGVMVQAASPIRRLADLASRSLCVEPGTEAERGAAAGLARRGIAFHEFPFQEQVELLDAFTSGRCDAIAEESTTLGALARDAARIGKAVRILPGPMSPDPLLAMTPARDGAWGALVAWTMATLIDGHGPRALPIRGAALGLAPGWQGRALAAGDYAALYRASLGGPLGLPPGPNAPTNAGGLLAAPFSQ